MAAEARTRRHKRLIVACDGTWMNMDSAWVGWPAWLSFGKPEPLRSICSNVTRICRAIAHESKDGIEQIVYYQAGVGSENSWTQHIVGGIVGSGVIENIREAYEFIASNWQAGDEIILLGFSRGAFTARSVCGLISAVGILTRGGMDEFLPIFSDWENQLDGAYQQRWPEHRPSSFSKRPNFQDGSYLSELTHRHITRPNVPVKAVGVWDTVGSLGVPDIGPFSFRRELSFVDTEVSPNVCYAFQCLALDEKRRPYTPTVWQSPKEKPNDLILLKQCWFPGVHSNIGSGYTDTEIADLTLAWMIAHLDVNGIVDFIPEYCIEQHELNVRFYRESVPPQAVRTWGLGKIYNSMTLLFWPAGEAVRTPGRMCETDPQTGYFIASKRLNDTQEFIHPSVRIRLKLHGDGADGSTWKPESLQDFKLLPPPENRKGRKRVTRSAQGKQDQRHRWVSQTGIDDVEIYEDKLLGIELELLKCSPTVYEQFKDSL